MQKSRENSTVSHGILQPVTVKKEKHPSLSPLREQRAASRAERNQHTVNASRGRIARTKELVKLTEVIMNGRGISSKPRAPK